jgi:hypothetical protein
LQPLNAKLLRELIEALDEPDFIQWILNVDQIPTDLETQLLNFEKLTKEWGLLLRGWDHWGKGKAQGLQGQLAKLKMATDVESHIQAFSAANLKLFGANHVWWTKRFLDDKDNATHALYLGGLDYDSHTVGVIAIEPKHVTLSKHRINHGEEPPASFDEQPPPPQVWWVRVDSVVVYERETPTLPEHAADDREPIDESD